MSPVRGPVVCAGADAARLDVGAARDGLSGLSDGRETKGSADRAREERPRMLGSGDLLTTTSGAGARRRDPSAKPAYPQPRLPGRPSIHSPVHRGRQCAVPVSDARNIVSTGLRDRPREDESRAPPEVSKRRPTRRTMRSPHITKAPFPRERLRAGAKRRPKNKRRRSLPPAISGGDRTFFCAGDRCPPRSNRASLAVRGDAPHHGGVERTLCAHQ